MNQGCTTPQSPHGGCLASEEREPYHLYWRSTPPVHKHHVNDQCHQNRVQQDYQPLQYVCRTEMRIGQVKSGVGPHFGLLQTTLRWPAAYRMASCFHI